MDGEKLKNDINDIFLQKSVYGKIFGCKFLPDYRQLFRLEREKKNMIFYNDLINNNKLNFIAKFMIRNKIKNNQKFY